MDGQAPQLQLFIMDSLEGSYSLTMNEKRTLMVTDQKGNSYFTYQLMKELNK